MSVEVNVTVDDQMVAPGDEIAVRVEVVRGGRCRCVRADLAFVESSPSYSHTADRPVGASQRPGRRRLVEGDTLAFSLRAPLDALPSIEMGTARLGWAVVVELDVPRRRDVIEAEGLWIGERGAGRVDADASASDTAPADLETQPETPAEPLTRTRRGAVAMTAGCLAVIAAALALEATSVLTFSGGPERPLQYLGAGAIVAALVLPWAGSEVWRLTPALRHITAGWWRLLVLVTGVGLVVQAFRWDLVSAGLVGGAFVLVGAGWRHLL